VPSSSFISTRATSLASDAPESSKAAASPPSPTGAWSISKWQQKKGDKYSGGAFHYPGPFSLFHGKLHDNYGSTNHVEASIASDDEALDDAIEGMMNLGSKVATG
jgi:hypothetical protein